MRDCLCVSVYHSDKGDAEFGTAKERFFHFTGDFLMECLQVRANVLENQRPSLTPSVVKASEDKPLAITQHGLWISVWSTLKRGGQPARTTDSYFLIGGRKIRRMRAGSGGFADGFYMVDLALSGTGTGRGPDVWKKPEGASYRDFAGFFRSHGGNLIEKSEAITGDLRKILTIPTTNYGPCLAPDVRSALPMLAAAMFIAEPARNPRAFIVGLMMLDMVGRVYNTDLNQAKFYTLDKVFAHPARIGTGSANHQKGPVVVQDNRYGRTVGRVTNPYGAQTTDSVYVEGKYPASPKLSSKTSQTVDLGNDYIQKKELSILSRWLANQLNKDLTNGCLFRAVRYDDAGRGVPSTDPSIQSDSIARDARDAVSILIKNLIQKRSSTFDKM
jgi:hypothetical protein